MSSPIAIIIYTEFGHIGKLAETLKKAIENKDDNKNNKKDGEGGKLQGKADIYQVPETLPAEVLEKTHARPKPNYPIATKETLTQYNAFLFGIPTRFGNMPAQMKTFWDTTGKLWTAGSLAGKYAGIFVSTGSLGGGQEMTPLTFMSTLVHHGMIFVPLGYASGMMKLIEKNELEARGASPWGAGTFATMTGSREPSELELNIAKCQGREFHKIVSRVTFA